MSNSKMTPSECGKLGYEKEGGLKEYIKNKSQRLLNEYMTNPSICNHCGMSLPYNKRHNKFCNHSCSASHNNSGVCRNSIDSDGNSILGTTKSIKPTCIHCGDDINGSGKKYCSTKCGTDYRWDIRKNKFLSGEYQKHNIESSIRVTAKRYLIECFGNTCSICGGTEWMGNVIPLVCDHIDGNPTNNNPINFRLVCGNCDMQLPTYKAKNKGNGREYRRKNAK